MKAIDLLGVVVVTLVLLASCALIVGATGCGRAICPACAPMLVCEEWPPPEYPSGWPSTSASWEVPDWGDAGPPPAPSGSGP